MKQKTRDFIVLMSKNSMSERPEWAQKLSVGRSLCWAVFLRDIRKNLLRILRKFFISSVNFPIFCHNYRGLDPELDRLIYITKTGYELGLVNSPTRTIPLNLLVYSSMICPKY